MYARMEALHVSAHNKFSCLFHSLMHTLNSGFPLFTHRNEQQCLEDECKSEKKKKEHNEREQDQTQGNENLRLWSFFERMKYKYP